MMGVFYKGVLIATCVICIMCAAGALVSHRDTFGSPKRTMTETVTMVCIITYLIMISFVLIVVLVSIVFSAMDRIMGLGIALIAGASTILATIAYAGYHKPELDGRFPIPWVGEWIIAGMTSTVGLFFIATLLVVE